MMQSDVSSDTRNAVVTLALRTQGRIRLAMRGSSMLPFLRDGMVLDVAQIPRLPRIGEIAVFRSEDRLVAHRVVEVRDGVIVCSGDAQPDTIERIAPGDVVGVVDAVFSSDGPNATRVDSPQFRARGTAIARLRALRAAWLLGSPFARPHLYASLVDAAGAVVQNDTARLERVIESSTPWKLASVARRHRLGSLLCAAAQHVPSEKAAGLATLLRRKHWASILRTKRIRAQALEVVAILRDAGIEAVLLKGAARLVAGDPDAEHFDAQDIDALVHPSSIERAARALREAGYREHPVPGAPDYAVHHHAAPLYPPEGGVPVELHRSLGNAERFDIPWTLDDLQAHVVVSANQRETTLVLDRVGSAIHLAVHACGRPKLRDIVLLARALRSMSADERVQFAAAVNREERQRMPLSGALAFAARLAGISWPEEPCVRRYVEWMIQREDLPNPLRTYTNCTDAWFAASRNRAYAAIAASHTGPTRRPIARATMRLLCAAATACYLPLRSKPAPPV